VHSLTGIKQLIDPLTAKSTISYLKGFFIISVRFRILNVTLPKLTPIVEQVRIPYRHQRYHKSWFLVSLLSASNQIDRVYIEFLPK